MINKNAIDYIKNSYSNIKLQLIFLKNLKKKKNNEEINKLTNEYLNSIIENCDIIYFNLRRLNITNIEFDYQHTMKIIQLINSNIKNYKKIVKLNFNYIEDENLNVNILNLSEEYENFYELFSNLLQSCTIKSNINKSINFSYDNFNDIDT